MSRMLLSPFVKFLFLEGVEQNQKGEVVSEKQNKYKHRFPSSSLYLLPHISSIFLCNFSLHPPPSISSSLSGPADIDSMATIGHNNLNAKLVSRCSFRVSLWSPSPCILSNFHESDLRFFLVTWEPESPVSSCALSRASFLNSRLVIWCLAIKKA